MNYLKKKLNTSSPPQRKERMPSLTKLTTNLSERVLASGLGNFPAHPWIVVTKWSISSWLSNLMKRQIQLLLLMDSALIKTKCCLVYDYCYRWFEQAHVWSLFLNDLPFCVESLLITNDSELFKFQIDCEGIVVAYRSLSV